MEEEEDDEDEEAERQMKAFWRMRIIVYRWFWKHHVMSEWTVEG